MASLETVSATGEKKIEDDGSLPQAESKCQEAWQVLRLEGWKRASEELKKADEILKTVQEEVKQSKPFRVTWSSYLFVEGEMYWRAGYLARALTVLHQSLEIMVDILLSHTSTTRCLNAIGNCLCGLGEADEAIKYYTRAYQMRKELSGSLNHPDMPLFKGQIGTGHEEKGRIYRKAGKKEEASKQFREAIKYYQKALELEKEVPGTLNTALYNRNIANAHAWLEEDKEAYQPARNGYDIRKDILGNHPWTARSAFQMAEICQRLKNYDDAKKFYEEAWEIEKSLRPGNHSVVMVRIVDSYEGMLEGVRKAELQKETFEFFLSYWNEEKNFKKFEFSSTNKQVIDSINKRLSDSSDMKMQEKYKKEAFWFYKRAWNSPDTKKLPDSHREVILQALKSYASSIEEKKRAEKYGALLKDVKQGGSLDSSLSSLPPSGSTVEKLSSKNQDVCNIDQDITKKQEAQSLIEEQELEEPENPDKQEPIKKKKIREDRVPVEGDTWNLQEIAALVTFYPGAITKPVQISCSLWNPRTFSPPLGSNEVLVSKVIELSHDGPPDLEFSGDPQASVTVALMHSASNFRGYEVVIKQLVDPENNEWRDLVTNTFWHTSAESTIPNWLFPFAGAACSITRCSSFAAIWRLKSFIFWKPKTVTTEFTCTVRDYPDVSVSIPWNSLPAKEDFCVTLKVQELPSIGPNAEGMLIGPVLHISSHNVELFKPAKITIPLTFFQGREDLANLRCGQWRILHYSREKSQEWTESNDQLVMPPVLTDGMVTFQVKHFCRIWLWWLKIKTPFGRLQLLACDLYKRSMAKQAGFLACLCDVEPTKGSYLLTLSCFPINLKYAVDSHISKTYNVSLQGEGSSDEPLCTDDQAFVSFSEAFSLQQSGNNENCYLRFLGSVPFEKSWPVTVRDLGNLQVDFFKSQEGEENKRRLCTLHIIPRTPVSPMESSRAPVSGKVPLDSPAGLVQKNEPSVKRSSETPCISPKRIKLTMQHLGGAVKDGAPQKDDLEGLAVEIVAKWKELGRRLLDKDTDEAELYAIDQENAKLSEKAYKMLLKWKSAKGSGATFHVLHDALCHSLVNRRDLAEKYCLIYHH